MEELIKMNWINCDNRLERSKVFLQEIAVVLGFDVTALSIIATLARTKEYPTILSLIKNSKTKEEQDS